VVSEVGFGVGDVVPRIEGLTNEPGLQSVIALVTACEGSPRTARLPREPGGESAIFVLTIVLIPSELGFCQSVSLAVTTLLIPSELGFCQSVSLAVTTLLIPSELGVCQGADVTPRTSGLATEAGCESASLPLTTPLSAEELRRCHVGEVSPRIVRFSDGKEAQSVAGVSFGVFIPAVSCVAAFSAPRGTDTALGDVEDRWVLEASGPRAAGRVASLSAFGARRSLFFMACSEIGCVTAVPTIETGWLIGGCGASDRGLIELLANDTTQITTTDTEQTRWRPNRWVVHGRIVCARRAAAPKRPSLNNIYNSTLAMVE
jgi:hypothetical protein